MTKKQFTKINKHVKENSNYITVKVGVFSTEEYIISLLDYLYLNKYHMVTIVNNIFTNIIVFEKDKK